MLAKLVSRNLGVQLVRSFGNKGKKFNAMEQVERVMKARENKQPKSVVPEPYIRMTDLNEKGEIVDLEVRRMEDIHKVERYRKDEMRRGLVTDEKPIPMIPTFGPIRVENPKLFTKKYRWCACGMSVTQVLFFKLKTVAVL
jgi:hypothetical protein